jgi:hypothetical protein
MEQEVCIAERDAGIDMDGEKYEAGLCCWMEEYPEEGSIALTGNSALSTDPAAAEAQGVPSDVTRLSEKCGAEVGRLEGEMVWAKFHSQASLEAFAAAIAEHPTNALRVIIRMADNAKEPCGESPESPAAIRNGKFASIAHIAAQGLGWVSGPSLAASPQPANPASAPVSKQVRAFLSREYNKEATTPAQIARQREIGALLDSFDRKPS